MKWEIIVTLSSLEFIFKKKNPEDEITQLLSLTGMVNLECHPPPPPMKKKKNKKITEINT